MRRHLLALAAGCAISTPCSAEWREITTADTHIISEVRDKETLEIAQSLADFRLAITSMFPAFKRHPHRPVQVFLLNNRSARMLGGFCKRPCGANDVRTPRGMYVAVDASGRWWST